MEAEPKDVGDQALMRGLATAFPIVRPRSAPILLRASALLPATKRLTGIPSAVVPPPPMHDDKKGARSGCLHLPGNRPHEPDQFTGDSGADHRRSFAARSRLPVAGRQAALRLPSNLSYCWRHLLEPV